MLELPKKNSRLHLSQMIYCLMIYQAQQNQTLSEAPIDEDTIIAQKLCDHLNMITDFKKRIESIDYLSEQAKKNFTEYHVIFNNR